MSDFSPAVEAMLSESPDDRQKIEQLVQMLKQKLGMHEDKAAAVVRHARASKIPLHHAVQQYLQAQNAGEVGPDAMANTALKVGDTKVSRNSPILGPVRYSADEIRQQWMEQAGPITKADSAAALKYQADHPGTSIKDALTWAKTSRGGRRASYALQQSQPERYAAEDQGKRTCTSFGVDFDLGRNAGTNARRMRELTTKARNYADEHGLPMEVVMKGMSKAEKTGTPLEAALQALIKAQENKQLFANECQ